MKMSRWEEAHRVQNEGVDQIAMLPKGPSTLYADGRLLPHNHATTTLLQHLITSAPSTSPFHDSVLS